MKRRIMMLIAVMSTSVFAVGGAPQAPNAASQQGFSDDGGSLKMGPSTMAPEGKGSQTYSTTNPGQPPEEMSGRPSPDQDATIPAFSEPPASDSTQLR